VFSGKQEQQQDQKLRQRKRVNIPLLQQSILQQSLPVKIMQIAREGGHTCILLIDQANKASQFQKKAGHTVYQKAMGLMPEEVPAKQRQKPLFVFVRQGGLDASRVPSATLMDHGNGVLDVYVSCRKEGLHGPTDCYRKQAQGDFVKNPMDDFVLLTLKNSLISFYHEYARRRNKDTQELRMVERLKQLLVEDNPFGVLAQDTETGDYLNERYRNAVVVQDLPYTWHVSNDLFRDWTRAPSSHTRA
jgi:hypothetical protein